jgi:hypothetical protein
MLTPGRWRKKMKGKPKSVLQNSVEQTPIDTQKELAALTGVGARYILTVIQ